MLSDNEPTKSQQQKVDDMIEDMNSSTNNGIIGGIADSSGMYPVVLPSDPTFSVPPNPLLPPEYSEVLDYNSIQYMNRITQDSVGRYVRIKMFIMARIG